MRLPASFAAFIATRTGKAVVAGMLGVAALVAAVGVVLATGGGNGSDLPAIPGSGASPAATLSPGPAATATAAAPSPSPSAAPSPGTTPTPTAVPSPSPTPSSPQGTAAPQRTATAAAPPATATPEPTTAPEPSPVVAGGTYCPGASPDTLPTTLAGLITIGGEPAPAGTVVTLLFDGVAGPSTTVVQEDGRSGFTFRFSPGATGCANRPGAGLTVVVDGAGYSVGSWTAGEPFLLRNVVVP